jgi:hypothetical protein
MKVVFAHTSMHMLLAQKEKAGPKDASRSVLTFVHCNVGALYKNDIAIIAALFLELARKSQNRKSRIETLKPSSISQNLPT